MKTTVELPDDLVRAIRVRAARQDLKLEDLVSELLRKGLAVDDEGGTAGRRVQFPLIKGTRRPSPDEELTPERVSEILAQEEVERLGR